MSLTSVFFGAATSGGSSRSFGPMVKVAGTRTFVSGAFAAARAALDALAEAVERVCCAERWRLPPALGAEPGVVEALVADAVRLELAAGVEVDRADGADVVVRLEAPQPATASAMIAIPMK